MMGEKWKFVGTFSKIELEFEFEFEGYWWCMVLNVDDDEGRRNNFLIDFNKYNNDMINIF
jgi:hypothetical protein